VMRAAVAVSVVLLFAGWSSDAPSPGSSGEVYLEPGPPSAHFDMDIRGEVACPEGSGGTICLRIRIKNWGNVRGSGSCQVLGQTTAPEGGDASIPGPRFELTDVAPGAVVHEIAVWTGERPSGGFRGLCDPGLES
jgi:hypothetical protein